MNVNEFFVKLIFLLIPGIIGSKIYRKLKANKGKKNWEDFLEIFLFSIFSYAILGILMPGSKIMENLIKTDKIEIVWNEILWACVISVFMAFFCAMFYNKKLINKFGRLIKVTKSFGDDDVWEYLNNSPNFDWVFVRDHKFDIVYYGNIIAFSDPDKKRELLLENVSVYRNSTGEHMYDMDVIYFSREIDDISIEIPQLADKLPEKIKISDFEEEIIKKINDEDDIDYLNKYYIKDQSKDFYSLKGNLSRKKKMKIKLLFESIEFPTTSKNKSKKISKEV